jgi:hypothetical protein
MTRATSKHALGSRPLIHGFGWLFSISRLTDLRCVDASQDSLASGFRRAGSRAVGPTGGHHS